MDGLLIVDKPRGLTSHDVVARARRMLREKRIGHAGTLDPMATGVLVLCVGQATRLSEYLLGEDKGYEGEIALGARTNTDDADGEVIEVRPLPEIDEAALRALERAFSGEIAQVPPQFSAIQQGGRRAYALARKGERVELEARKVVVHQLELSRIPAGLRVRVACSAGTYIRSLARDIGEALGCGGHLAALRRTRSGHFALSDAVALEQVEAAAQEGRAASLLLPMDRAVPGWPALALNDDQARRLRNGQVIALAPSAPELHGRPEALARVYDAGANFIAVARWDGAALVPVKVFDAAAPLV